MYNLKYALTLGGYKVAPTYISLTCPILNFRKYRIDKALITAYDI